MGYTANSVEEGQWSGYFKRKRRLAKPMSGVSWALELPSGAGCFVFDGRLSRADGFQNTSEQ